MIDGDILCMLRRRAGCTQADVAEAAGIPASVLSAYERGRRQPSLAAASRIVDALGCSVTFDFVLDPAEQARRLHDVLELAEALPYRPRPLHRPTTTVPPTRLIDRIVAVCESLDRADIPWALCGALALAYATTHEWRGCERSRFAEGRAIAIPEPSRPPPGPVVYTASVRRPFVIAPSTKRFTTV